MFYIHHFCCRQRSSSSLGSNLFITMLPLSPNLHNQAIPMGILFIFLLQFSLFVASTSSNQALDAIILQNKDGREQREFDYFNLALQWPGTICKGARHCCSSNACCNRWMTYPCYIARLDCLVNRFFRLIVLFSNRSSC